jgi:hypothetical protein
MGSSSVQDVLEGERRELINSSQGQGCFAELGTFESHPKGCLRFFSGKVKEEGHSEEHGV